jgi:hypothetical protein
MIYLFFVIYIVVYISTQFLFLRDLYLYSYINTNAYFLLKISMDTYISTHILIRVTIFFVISTRAYISINIYKYEDLFFFFCNFYEIYIFIHINTRTIFFNNYINLFFFTYINMGSILFL